jgi:DNA/RNA endonuclease YhcR with UshA esterase domain
MKKTCISLAILGSLAAAVPAAAHHAFAAEFDVNKPVSVKGTITKVEWVNPHAWLYVDVKEADGTVTNWHFELGPPNALFRLGWKKDAIPAGTEVTITGFRAKGQDAVANGRSITLPDGKELFSGGSDPTQNAK